MAAPTAVAAPTAPTSAEWAHGDRLGPELLRACGFTSEAEARAGVVDFAANINPYGPAPTVSAALAEALPRLDRYPDPDALAPRRALAEALDTVPERIVLGNGASELLWSVMSALLAPGDAVLLATPTFSEYATAVTARGGRLHALSLRARDGFRLAPDRLVAHARRTRAHLVILCSPNNPTGQALAPEHVHAVAGARPDLLVLVDESFLSLSDRAGDAAAAMPDNVLRLRSLTKDHALPGLRLGYVEGARELIARIEAARPPWSTGVLTQTAAVAACASADFVTRSREWLRADRDALRTGLIRLGYAPLPSAAPFFLLPVRSGSAFRETLLMEHRIHVRDCTSFGLPAHVRLAARPEADRRQLLGALARPAPGLEPASGNPPA